MSLLAMAALAFVLVLFDPELACHPINGSGEPLAEGLRCAAELLSDLDPFKSLRAEIRQSPLLVREPAPE
jgi:hypothetical protein